MTPHALLQALRYRLQATGWRTPESPQAGTDAVRPLGLVALDGVTHDTWFCHPPASLTDTFLPMGAHRVVVPVGLLPEAARGRATVIISGTIAAGAEERHATLQLQATAAGRWHTLEIAVPPHTAPVTLTITTRVPDHGDQSWVWAVVGAPTWLVPRSSTEWRTHARVWLAHLRRDGVGATWRRLRDRTRPTTQISYPAWCRTHDPDEAALRAQRAAADTRDTPPLVSIVTPAYNSRPEWLRECYASLAQQSWPHWEWCVCDDASPQPETAETLALLAATDPRIRWIRRAVNGGIAHASNDALTLSRGAFVGLLDHDDTLPPWALSDVIAAFDAAPEADLLYTDEDKLEADGTRSDPYFKPDWSPDLLEATNYACHFTVLRRDLMARVGGFQPRFDGAQDHDLWLRASEMATRVLHVPRVCYHWRKVPGSTAAAHAEKPFADDAGRRAIAAARLRRGLPDDVVPGATPGRYRVRGHAKAPQVSVLMPTFGAETCPPHHASVVARACTSLQATAGDAALEFVLATDDGTAPDEVRRALAGIPHRIVAVPGPFNFSARINAAAAASTHALLLLANDDLEAREPGWLQALCDYALQSSIGAVGLRLDLPDGRLQHAGLVLGVCGLAAHAFHHAAPSDPGYFGAVITPRNVSAVTAACLLTRRDVFESVGGFDPALAIDFNDVDFCLKVWSSGRRVVYTPHGRLLHHEGASIGGRAPAATDEQLMRERWGGRVEQDPFYNPNLSTTHADFRLR